MIEDNSGKLIIITGCDSGIGRFLMDECRKRGHPVLISYCEVESYTRYPDLYTCRLDIRRQADINVFIDECSRLLQKYTLYALVNNAGIAMGGPVENLTLDVFRDVMEVNYFGLVDITRRMIPFLIRDRARLVIHGSMAGRIALPFLSPYAASKYALEGFTDSLRRELSPFGIKTILLETAGVATPIWQKARNMDMSSFDQKYHESLNQFLEKFVDQGNNGLEPEIAAQRIYRIMVREHPRRRYIIARNIILSRLQLFIPQALLDLVFAKLFKMNYGG